MYYACMAESDRYSLNSRTEFEAGKPDLYIFDIVYCHQSEASSVSVAGSNNVIKVFAADTLQPVNQLTGHRGGDGRISSLEHSGRRLWSASTDGTIRSWDLRSSTEKSLTILQGHNKEPVNGIAVSSDSYLIVAGTDKVAHDASIYVWDTRTDRAPIAHFVDSHSDDVTCVKFSPSSMRTFASGSVDGLVCVFDLATVEEEEAIVAVKNTESSVASVGFFGSESELLFSLTHTENFHTWSIAEPEPIYSPEKVREQLKEEFQLSADYLINCHYQSSSDRLYLLAGDNSGGIHVVQVDKRSLQPVSTLSGGHSATIRASSWGPEAIGVLTGGEDGVLCSWLSS